MKKVLALLLSALFLFSACEKAVEESTSAPSESSQPIIEEDDGIMDYTLVSVGKPYTLSIKSNESYPDKYDQQLTDGHKVANEGAHYSDSRMVGFSSDVTVQIDLGEDGKRISAFVARALDMSIDGVALASRAVFRGSKDGKIYKNLGAVAFVPTGDNTVSEARLNLKEVQDYQYVRITVQKGSNLFLFLDEVEVYADVPAKQYNDTVSVAYINENIDRFAWKELSTGVEALPKDTEDVALGKKYAFSNAAFDKRAPKNDTFLTDNERTNRYFGDDVWVGLAASPDKKPSINLNLGNTRADIYGFRVHTLGFAPNVSYADYIDVYATFTTEVFVGRMYAPKSGNNYVYSFYLPEYIKANKIRFEFANGENTNYWIEQIEVIVGSNDDIADVLYAPVNIPTVTEDIYWDSNDSDYKTKQNLLLGKPQHIASSYYAYVNKAAEKAESTDKTTVLTDGKLCTDPNLYCYGGAFFYARNGGSIDFFYDLGALSTVEGVNVNLLEQKAWGISRPKHIDVFLSDDATNWYKVYNYSHTNETINDNAVLLDFGTDFSKPYVARFVRFRVESAVTFIDEFEVFGTKQIKSGAKRLADTGIKSVIYYTNQETAQFASVENTPLNASDIPIIYPNGTKEESLLPMVAYIDKEGNIKDTFMDGFLIGPYGPLASGAMGHELNYKQDWEYCKNIYFDGQSGLDKLEAVVQQVKDALNLPDYKVQIYFTMPTLRSEVADFGDVDGDGISENLSVKADREKVIDWFTNLCISEFESRGYKNLEIDGFYWINEAVIWENDDAHIITEVSEYVHKTGYNFLWVPYYVANRYFLGYEMGFDMVSMQPNAVFDNHAPLWKIPSCADMTKARKMCVEIEHSYQCLGDPDFTRVYMLYLYYGAVTGYMDSIHVYYHDLENFAKMAYIDSELCRMQYDATYQFVKRTLDVTPDKKDDVKLTVSADTVLDGSLNGENKLSKFTLVSSPENGYLTFGSDGEFRYFPNKGFTGTDKFTYTYNNFLGESEECVVEITVG